MEAKGFVSILFAAIFGTGTVIMLTILIWNVGKFIYTKLKYEGMTVKSVALRWFGIKRCWCIKCHKKTTWVYISIVDDYLCKKCGQMSGVEKIFESTKDLKKR